MVVVTIFFNQMSDKRIEMGLDISDGDNLSFECTVKLEKRVVLQ